MMTVYGPRSAAEELIERVLRMHGHVSGITPDGTASFGFVQAYHLYAGPLSSAGKDMAFPDAAPAAAGMRGDGDDARAGPHPAAAARRLAARNGAA